MQHGKRIRLALTRYGIDIELGNGPRFFNDLSIGNNFSPVNRLVSPRNFCSLFSSIELKLIVFDNWRVLHGRSAFTGTRRVCGGYSKLVKVVLEILLTN